MKMRLRKKLLRLNQFIVKGVCKALFSLTTKRRLHHEGMDSFVPGRSVIIAANHQSELDPFAIIAFMPEFLVNKILPIKFLTANVYYFGPLRPFAASLGCLPAHDNKSHVPYGVEGAVYCIQNGYSFCIFPEGKRTQPHNPLPAKPGISRVLEKVPDAQVILAHIQWTRRRFRRRLLTISFSMQTSQQLHNAQDILDRIYGLKLP